MSRNGLLTAAAVGLVALIGAFPSFATAAPPSNDDFGSATVVTSLPFVTDGFLSMAEATAAADDPSTCAGPTEASVWYAFTAPRDMTVEALAFGNGYASVVSAYTGTRANLTQVACDASATSGQWDQRDSKFTLDVSAGTTYYFEVSTPGSAAGEMNFRLNDASTAATNTDITSATLISSVPYTAPSINVSAAPSGPSGCGSASSNTVWYAFTPSKDMKAVVETANTGSSYSNEVRVSTGAPDDLQFVTCGVGEARFDATAGTRYWIMVAKMNPGAGIDGNVLNLRVTEGFKIEALTVNATGVAVTAPTGVGTARVSGTVKCNAAETVSVFVHLNQAQRESTVYGNGYAEVPCSSSSTRWEVNVSPGYGRFHPGTAVTSPWAAACTATGCDSVYSAETTLRLLGGTLTMPVLR